jgi:hypothetical protein
LSPREDDRRGTRQKLNVAYIRIAVVPAADPLSGSRSIFGVAPLALAVGAPCNGTIRPRLRGRYLPLFTAVLGRRLQVGHRVDAEEKRHPLRIPGVELRGLAKARVALEIDATETGLAVEQDGQVELLIGAQVRQAVGQGDDRRGEPQVTSWMIGCGHHRTRTLDAGPVL